VLALSACGDDGRPRGDSSITVDSGAGDGAMDASDTAVADTGPIPIPDGCVAVSETCNGADDDCDGFVDEGRGVELTCAPGQECVGGACTCPAGNLCDGVCVDLASDRNHCGSCGAACPTGQVCGTVGCCDPGVDSVDLLFMVDNSNSMSEEQASLAAGFPQLITALTTGDANADGTVDFPAVTDLHVGVITADMGVGGYTVPTCSNADFGDDGVLRTVGNTSITGCAATYPAFLAFTAGSDVGDFANDFACVATVGTGGCGFEQQLEATLKALTPSTSRTRFHDDSTGHANGANSGFLRPDSVLGIVLVTDEEDCSAANPELFDPSSETFTSDLNLRCFSYPSAVHPVSRYVGGLIEARGRSGDVVFTAITGIPPDLAGTDYGAMLADPRMVEQIDPSMPTRLSPSCNVPGRGFAFPPRRIVSVAQELSRRGSATTIESICQADFTSAIEAIADRVGAVVGVSCGPD
jgi:hypothetical protein